MESLHIFPYFFRREPGRKQSDRGNRREAEKKGTQKEPEKDDRRSKQKKKKREQRGVVQSQCYSQSLPPAKPADQVSFSFPSLPFLITCALCKACGSNYCMP
jgi:hypothetical protein